jgi:flagellar motor component MotA
MIQIETSQQYADMTPMDIYNITDYFQKNTNKEQELLNNIANVKNIINQSGVNDFQKVEWNIFKHIELDSGYDYFKISNLRFPIIGNNDKDIIHIVLKTDISQFNNKLNKKLRLHINKYLEL